MGNPKKSISVKAVETFLGLISLLSIPMLCLAAYIRLNELNLQYELAGRYGLLKEQSVIQVQWYVNLAGFFFSLMFVLMVLWAMILKEKSFVYRWIYDM